MLDTVAPLARDLAGLEQDALRDLGDDALLAHLSALEDLKDAACAVQARLTVALDASLRRAAAARGVPARQQGRETASYVGLARRESPAKAGRLVGLAKVLVAELPETMAALAQGRTNEWRATLLARETGTLSLTHRQEVDAELGPRLGALGDRTTAHEARRAGYRRDPAQLVARTARAESERTVTLRPAPDQMTYLTALLPVAQGVAVHAALTAHARARQVAGDERGLGQLRADTLVARLAGAEAPPAGEGPDQPAAPRISLSLVMSERAALGDSHEPAQLTGYGPIPAHLGRRLLWEAATVWLRRLFTTADGDLLAADARKRFFAGALREVVVVRDQWCRTPWCGAPIRHVDHVERHADGGPTDFTNNQGLCARCDGAKEAAAWRATVAPGPGHRVVTRTRLGTTVTSDHAEGVPLPTDGPTSDAPPDPDAADPPLDLSG